MTTAILIPAYEPDGRLPQLVIALRRIAPDRPVVVVDDGSGRDYRDVFDIAEAAGADVVRIGRNQGKGFALRVGIRTIMRDHPGHDVVTADSDGQHGPADIERVARALAAQEAPTIVLGSRAFEGEEVPGRSRFGNRMTRVAFRLVAGVDVRDTQTGLRGLPASALEWLLTVAGDRFDYEFRVLLQARAAGFGLSEVPIATIYTEGNASSHFRPLVDSVRIYAPLARFAASALVAFGIDTLMLLLLQSWTGWLLFSVVGARLISGSVNYAVNRSMVFRRGREIPVRVSALRYISLAGLLLAANFGIITALTQAGIPLLAAKVMTEATLFAVSFGVQRTVVFARRDADASPSAHSGSEGVGEPRGLGGQERFRGERELVRR
ncbi:MAG: bifunctional glycosyltransferase family 2/GtrA family protein [Microbacterium sp.]|uniref:GtrA family protein n=1 Tax=Microbacterium sp. TaxID=51671 RepID=UPI0039E58C54